MRMVIYFEVDSAEQRDRVWERLENMVETDELSGFFTLTVDGSPCVQDAHRGDLDRLAEVVADAVQDAFRIARYHHSAERSRPSDTSSS
jgi:hypothetical protein